MTPAHNPFDLAAAMALLSKDRPLFHSEADFQLSMAWSLQQRQPDAVIRLEYRAPIAGARLYLDLLYQTEGVRWAIELKYKTRALSCTVDGEPYSLMNHGAQDLGRYDFFRDVERIERLKIAGVVDGGCAIMLSNDSSYWSAPTRTRSYGAFALSDGRVVDGSLEWGATAGPGTTKGRQARITLGAEYNLRWTDHSQPFPGPGGTFRYLLVECPPLTKSPG